jgi:hypothetical protein
MRARHRHFNPAHATASLCLDARFISGLSNDDPISTWSGRNTSGATAATTARPTYKTSILGGNPVARFNGSANVMTPDESDVAGCVIAVVDLASDVNHGLIGDSLTGAGTATPVGRACAWWGGSYKLSIKGAESWNTNGDFVFGERAFWNGSSATNTDANAGIVTFDRHQGSPVTWNPAAAQIYRIGRQGDTFVFLNGDVGAIAVLEASPSASLRKKIEKHLAYSFKISCN